MLYFFFFLPGVLDVDSLSFQQTNKKPSTIHFHNNGGSNVTHLTAEYSNSETAELKCSYY